MQRNDLNSVSNAGKSGQKQENQSAPQVGLADVEEESTKICFTKSCIRRIASSISSRVVIVTIAEKEKDTNKSQVCAVLSGEILGDRTWAEKSTGSKNVEKECLP